MKWLMTTLIQAVFTLIMYIMASLFFGAALIPGIALFHSIQTVSASYPVFLRLFCLGTSIAAGYFLFGFALIFLVGGFRTLFRLRLKEGNHPLARCQAFFKQHEPNSALPTR